MIELIAMDMDGTLLTPPPIHITEKTISVLKKASDLGIQLVLASGRLADDAGAFARDAGLDPAVIALNGSCMTLHPFGDLLFSYHFTSSQATSILHSLFHHNALFGMFCDHDLYVHETDPANPAPEMIWGTHLNLSRGKIYREEKAAWNLAERGASKFVIFDFAGANFIPKLRAGVEAVSPDLTFSSSWRDNLEINPPNVSKGIALKALCSMLSIPMAHVMTIGDNSNDLSMLQCSGCPVAMGNATEDILSAASYQTLSNEEDGVAEAISALALNECTKGVRNLEIPH